MELCRPTQLDEWIKFIWGIDRENCAQRCTGENGIAIGDWRATEGRDESFRGQREWNKFALLLVMFFDASQLNVLFRLSFG